MTLGTACITWFKGAWHDGNLPVLGAADHATWHGSLVFDGARCFEGVTPDLDLHAHRIIASTSAMGMVPPADGDTVKGLIEEGIKRIGDVGPLYLRPMMWSTDGTASILEADPDSTAFAVCIESLPMAEPGDMPITISPFRRPRQDTAMTEAKAACLYPNNARILVEARKRGFRNALSMDLDGNVAETASTNVFMVRDGEVLTPRPNGTFLNGITRQRVIKLLRADGLSVSEVSLTPVDFAMADEIFLTGNASKVMPVTRLDSRELGQGPISLRARELYWDYAHSRFEV